MWLINLAYGWLNYIECLEWFDISDVWYSVIWIALAWAVINVSYLPVMNLHAYLWMENKHCRIITLINIFVLEFMMVVIFYC